jgi:hypothetical protein
MKLKLAVLILTFLQLSLAQNTISGTLYATDVKNFVVIGCLIDISTQDCDYEKSQIAEVNADGTYTLNNVEAGQHLIIVWRDTNNSGDLEEGQDEIGYYTDAAGEPAFVNPPASGINITIQDAANSLTTTPTNNTTNPLTTGTTSPATVSGSIVGTWGWGTVSSSGYYNESTGGWSSSNGGGASYTFNTDNTYEGSSLLEINFYGCSTKIFNFEKGTYTLEDDVLMLIPVLDKTKSEEDCNPSKNYEKDLALEPKYFFVQFRRDISEFTGEDLGEVLDMTDLVINSAGNLEPDPEDPEPFPYRRETP